MQEDIKTLTAKVAALVDLLSAARSRTYNRNTACALLGICLKTFKSYYRTYHLPVADPSNRKAEYTLDDLELCADILRKAGKLKNGTILNLSAEIGLLPV